MTYRHAIALAICGLSTGAFAQAGTPSTIGPAVSGSGCPTCLTMPPPHTTVLNAANGAVVFPLPSSMRNFATTTDLANFLTQNLDAELVFDSTGTHLIGARGAIIQYGHSYYLDAYNQVQPITHPINAYIGGVSGQFTIGGVLYNSGAQGKTLLIPNDSTTGPHVLQCNQSGECISGHSWNSHYILNIRNSVGFEVSQEFGGYQEDRSVTPNRT